MTEKLRPGAAVDVYLDLDSGDFLVEESTESREIPGADTPSNVLAVSRDRMQAAGKRIIEESLARYGLGEPLEEIRSPAQQSAFVRKHKCVAIEVAAGGRLELTPCHREGRGYVGRFDEDGLSLEGPDLSQEAFWASLENAFERAS